MNNKLSILGAVVFALFSGQSMAAGDQPVNCRTETTGTVAIYGGFAQCSAYHQGQYIQVQDYIPETTTPTTYISELHGGSFVGCWANVPFLRYENVTEQVCDYTPKATMREYYIDAGNGQYVVGEKVVKFTASDRDGSVAQKKAWVDGSPVSTNFHTLKVPSGQSFASFNVKFEVTDNDGYVTTTSKNISVNTFPVCYGPGGQIILCDNEF